MNEVNSIKLIIPLIDKEHPQLTKEEKKKLANVVKEYLQLLDKGMIEEALNYLDEKHDFLVKML